MTERPTETLEMPSGTKVKMYTYLTVKERREVFEELGDDFDGSKMSPGKALKLQELLLQKLLVDSLNIDDLPVTEADYLAQHAQGKISSDPNVASGSK